MVPQTRRRLLQGATALLAGLAGCSGSSSVTSSSNDPRDAENVAVDPERVSLRNPANEPVVWLGDSETDDAPPTTEAGPRISDREEGIVDSEETAATLQFADVDGVGRARRFVETTDFDRTTLLLETRPVRECFRLELCGLTWSSNSYHTYFGRYYRPADVACRVDATDHVSWLLRIPDTIDPNAIRSRGSGTSGSGCTGFHRRYEEMRNETATEVASNSTPERQTGGSR